MLRVDTFRSRLLANALEHNSTLMTLNLFESFIGDQGAGRLAAGGRVGEGDAREEFAVASVGAVATEVARVQERAV